MKPEDEFPLGTICTLYGCRAIVRFNGQTAFATGAWIGLELDQPVGKNDGSVQGQRYFDCRPAHGVFMRAAQLQKELQSQSAATAPAAESKADNASRQSISSGSSKVRFGLLAFCSSNDC
jgi:dynactin 1